MYTYTNPTTWLVTILLVAGFSFVAGALASNSKISYSIRVCFIIGLAFLSFCSFVVLHKTTESSIKEIVEDVKQKTISYYENGELLANRFKPTNGWYRVAEVPVTTPLFLRSGDTTKYVVLTIHTDCAGFLKMAFPTKKLATSTTENRRKISW